MGKPTGGVMFTLYAPAFKLISFPLFSRWIDGD